MDASQLEFTLRDRKIAYAVTDCDLSVVEVGGAIDILPCDDANDWLGGWLPDLVPELLGSEDVLADIVAGRLPRFELAWANRETTGGETLYVNLVNLPFRENSEETSGLLHVVQDLTEMGAVDQKLTQARNELRLLQAQLARQNRELASANAELRRMVEMKSVFVSVAAHELRVPLTPIAGYVEMLLDGELGQLGERQREALEGMSRSIQRLQAITTDLLEVYRIEAGRVELVLQPTDLSALVVGVSEEFKLEIEGDGKELALEIGAELPTALCDRSRAARIVSNLLSNASRYTPRGGHITVSLGVREDGFLELAVADDGVGISPEDQPKVFDRFFRTRHAIGKRTGGFGLGLHITRSLVEMHGGRIWFESTLGEGSTFHVTFPVAEPTALSLNPDKA